MKTRKITYNKQIKSIMRIKKLINSKMKESYKEKLKQELGDEQDSDPESHSKTDDQVNETLD